jgi:hypothetical protein
MIEAWGTRLRFGGIRFWPGGLVEDRGISFQAVTFVNYSARAGLSGVFFIRVQWSFDGRNFLLFMINLPAASVDTLDCDKDLWVSFKIKVICLENFPSRFVPDCIQKSLMLHAEGVLLVVCLATSRYSSSSTIPRSSISVTASMLSFLARDRQFSHSFRGNFYIQ